MKDIKNVFFLNGLGVQRAVAMPSATVDGVDLYSAKKEDFDLQHHHPCKGKGNGFLAMLVYLSVVSLFVVFFFAVFQ